MGGGDIKPAQQVAEDKQAEIFNPVILDVIHDDDSLGRCHDSVGWIQIFTA
jgi:hypothetical protein